MFGNSSNFGTLAITVPPKFLILIFSSALQTRSTYQICCDLRNSEVLSQIITVFDESLLIFLIKENCNFSSQMDSDMFFEKWVGSLMFPISISAFVLFVFLYLSFYLYLYLFVEKGVWWLDILSGHSTTTKLIKEQLTPTHPPPNSQTNSTLPLIASVLIRVPKY